MCFGNCFNFKRSVVNVLPLGAMVVLPLTSLWLSPYLAIALFKACRRPCVHVGLQTWLRENRSAPKTITVQGGLKKPDCFGKLITLRRLVIEMGMTCQNLANFKFYLEKEFI